MREFSLLAVLTMAAIMPGTAASAHQNLYQRVEQRLAADPVLAGRLGSAPRLSSAKFLSPVRPGDRIEMSFDNCASTTRLGFEVRCGDRLAASGQFESTARGTSS